MSSPLFLCCGLTPCTRGRGLRACSPWLRSAATSVSLQERMVFPWGDSCVCPATAPISTPPPQPHTGAGRVSTGSDTAGPRWLPQLQEGRLGRRVSSAAQPPAARAFTPNTCNVFRGRAVFPPGPALCHALPLPHARGDGGGRADSLPQVTGSSAASVPGPLSHRRGWPPRWNGAMCPVAFVSGVRGGSVLS